MSLGARIDGIPTPELFGGGDHITAEWTSYIVYADPGLSPTLGSNTFT